MAPLLLAGLIAGGSSLLGSLISSGSNSKSVSDTNATNLDIAKYQAEQNLNLWNLENAYNTPSAQMARLQSAGLNPHLIYGNGSASTGNATSSAQSFDRPTMQAYQMPSDIFTNAANSYLNAVNVTSNSEKNKAQTAEIYQNIANLQQDNEIKQLKVIGEQYANAKSKAEANLWQDMLMARMANLDSQTTASLANAQLADANRFTNEALRPYVVQKAELDIRSAIETITGQKIDNSTRNATNLARIAQLKASAVLASSQTNLNDIEKQIKQTLKDTGLNLNNDDLDRVVYQFMNDSGVPNWLKIFRMANEVGRTVGSFF